MIEQFTDFILPCLEHFLQFGYWLAFVAALMETTLLVGLLIPGSTLLLFLGAYSVSGQLDIGGLIGFAIAGAILGDNFNYFLGRHYGQSWTERGLWFLHPEHFKKARQFFDRHGAISVFLGRFIPSIKEFMPFIAGTVGMHRPVFFFWNVLGATGWGFLWHSLNLAAMWLSRLKQWVYRHGQLFIHFSQSLWNAFGTAIKTNSDVIAFVERHSIIFDFLQRRLQRQPFSGLPLTLLGLAFIYVLALFGGIIEDLVTLDPIVYVDQNVAQIIADVRSQQVIQVFIWITELGKWQLVLPLMGFSILLLVISRRYLLALPLMVASAGSMSFAVLGKLVFHRPRPVENMLLEHSYSFPSGHATIAVAFYGFLGYLLIRHSSHWKHRVNLFFVSVTLILLIGISRLVLGAHFLSDVWAGYLLGTLWLIIAIGLTEWLIASDKVSIRNNIAADTIPMRYKTLTNTLIAGAFVYVVSF